MNFNFIIYLFLFPSNHITDINTYHKKIRFNNQNRCVQTNTTKEKATKYNAKLGSCIENNCNKYKGNLYIPNIGIVEGFQCI